MHGFSTFCWSKLHVYAYLFWWLDGLHHRYTESLQMHIRELAGSLLQFSFCKMLYLHRDQLYLEEVGGEVEILHCM